MWAFGRTISIAAVLVSLAGMAAAIRAQRARILAANQPRPASVAIRFNALGATFLAAAPFPKPGAQGSVEIYLRECVAEPLRLIGRVAGVSPGGEVKVRFLPPGEATADLLEKLAFRRHRRQVAGSRSTPRTRGR